MKQNVMIACLVLALIAAAGYILMAIGVIQPGDLMSENEPTPAIFYIVPAGYIIGGILIFQKKRWLWITGAVINGFGILVFYLGYASQPDVLWSAPGLITKIAQIPLEIGLIYLIVVAKRVKQTAE